MEAVRIELRGVEQVKANLRRLGSRAAQELGAALLEEGETIMTIAKVLCPVDTGVLRSTGHVRGPVFGPGMVRVILGFGGPAAPYAVYVHDNTGMKHKPPTQAKYLSTPVDAATPGAAMRIAFRLEAALGRA